MPDEGTTLIFGSWISIANKPCRFNSYFADFRINGLASNLRKIQFSDLIGNHKCESGSNSARALAVGEFKGEFDGIVQPHQHRARRGHNAQFWLLICVANSSDGFNSHHLNARRPEACASTTVTTSAQDRRVNLISMLLIGGSCFVATLRLRWSWIQSQKQLEVDAEFFTVLSSDKK